MISKLKTLPLLLFLFTLILLTPSCNKCENVICQNEGICDEDKCICPRGYQGEFCEKEKEPSKIKIVKIKVKKYPARNSGVHWDPDNIGIGRLPDLKIQIWQMKNGVSSIMLGETEIIEDALEGAIHQFNLGNESSIFLNEPTFSYRVILYDDDGVSNNDDLIYGPIFSPYNVGENFPKTVMIIDEKTIIELELKYFWTN